MSKQKLLKAYPFLAELDSYHIEVANILYKLRPHWLGYAKIDEFKGQKYLAVELLSPAHPEEWRVLIYTDNFEITVAWFSSWHGHFTRGNFPKEQALIKILSYLDEIINERDVLIFKHTYDQWNSKAGRFCSRDELESVDIKDMDYIWSWKGTYDKNLKGDS